MRKVRCGECGKVYDFDTDDFCPKCGAFNQPRKQTQISAGGSVVQAPEEPVRRDGINERNHAGSFVHAEFHEENRRRRGTSLEQGTKRGAVKIPARPPEIFKTLAGIQGQKKSVNGSVKVVLFIAILSFLLSVISSLLS